LLRSTRARISLLIRFDIAAWIVGSSASGAALATNFSVLRTWLRTNTAAIDPMPRTRARMTRHTAPTQRPARAAPCEPVVVVVMAGSGAEEFRLGGGEFIVGQQSGRLHVAQLLQLGHHVVAGSCWCRCGLLLVDHGLLGRLLLGGGLLAPALPVPHGVHRRCRSAGHHRGAGHRAEQAWATAPHPWT